MSDANKYNIELEPRKIGEENHLHKEPEDMKKWLYQASKGIKEQLESTGNFGAEIRRITTSVRAGFCGARSEENPANYMAKMISNLLNDYQDPNKKNEMEQAGIGKLLIKDIIEDAELAGLTKGGVYTHESVASELSASIKNVQDGWKRETEHEKNLAMSVSAAQNLEILHNDQITLNMAAPLLDINDTAVKLGHPKFRQELSKHIDLARAGRKFEDISYYPAELNASLKKIYDFTPQQLEAMETVMAKIPSFDSVRDGFNSLQRRNDDEMNYHLSQLKKLGVTPQEAQLAKQQYEIKERDKPLVEEAIRKDNEGGEKRTAAVYRKCSAGAIITTYDPNDKDSTGCYRNTRHYMQDLDGGLKPVSKEKASELLKVSADKAQSINNNNKSFDAKSWLRSAQIEYGAR